MSHYDTANELEPVNVCIVLEPDVVFVPPVIVNVSASAVV
jgi:hypothetical protein